MHTETHTGLESPKGIWWKPAHATEKVWVAIAFAWCMVLFAMMPLWHWKGGETIELAAQFGFGYSSVFVTKQRAKDLNNELRASAARYGHTLTAEQLPLGVIAYVAETKEKAEEEVKAERPVAEKAIDQPATLTALRATWPQVSKLRA